MKTRTLLTGRIYSNNNGFTFLEIIIVMVIMSLLVAIVLPQFNKMFAAVEGARDGDKIMHLLERVRSEAILQAEPVTVTFYTSGLCTFKLQGKVLQYEDLHMSVYLDKLEQIEQTFRPDGTAERDQLTFRSSEGRYVIFNFNPVSGQIEMERRSTL